MWLFTGSITLSKSCVNIAAAKKATGVREIVAHVGRQHEHAAGPDGIDTVPPS
jgi:hypothetical protein